MFYDPDVHGVGFPGIERLSGFDFAESRFFQFSRNRQEANATLIFTKTPIKYGNF